LVDFTQLPTLIANISGTKQDIKIGKIYDLERFLLRSPSTFFNRLYFSS